MHAHAPLCSCPQQTKCAQLLLAMNNIISQGQVAKVNIPHTTGASEEFELVGIIIIINNGGNTTDIV